MIRVFFWFDSCWALCGAVWLHIAREPFFGCSIWDCWSICSIGLECLLLLIIFFGWYGIPRDVIFCQFCIWSEGLCNE